MKATVTRTAEWSHTPERVQRAHDNYPPGASFDPKQFFDYCESQISGGGMDRKWFPDFVRVVAEFEYTQTEKILVRNLKKLHFDLNRRGDDSPVYFRRRGDTAYRRVTRADYEALRTEFQEREQLDLLDRQPARKWRSAAAISSRAPTPDRITSTNGIEVWIWPRQGRWRASTPAAASAAA